MEEVMVRIIEGRGEYVSRDQLLGYFNREGGLGPIVEKEGEILKEHGIESAERVGDQGWAEGEGREWEKYEWDQSDSDESFRGSKRRVVGEKK